MQVLKLRKNTTNKVEIAENAIKIFCIIQDIKISKAQLQVLSYLMVYGVSRKTINFIKALNLYKTSSTVDNTLSSLRNMGLLVREEIGSDSIIEGLNFPVETKLGIIIKLEH